MQTIHESQYPLLFSVNFRWSRVQLFPIKTTTGKWDSNSTLSSLRTAIYHDYTTTSSCEGSIRAVALFLLFFRLSSFFLPFFRFLSSIQSFEVHTCANITARPEVLGMQSFYNYGEYRILSKCYHRSLLIFWTIYDLLFVLKWKHRSCNNIQLELLTKEHQFLTKKEIQYYVDITVPLGTMKFDCYKRVLLYRS